ncbi:MAG: MBL fold metallo-hydrolase [Candidatus Paceibacterota bacterium]
MEIRHLVVGELITNCYLLFSEKELAIIDPGGSLERIVNEISKTGARPKYIILTHWHTDHTDCALDLQRKFGAQILIHQEEEKYLKFSPDRFLKNGDIIKIGSESLEVIHTPGHTQGSICLKVGQKLFTGDLLFIDGVGRTDLPGGSDSQIKESLQLISGIIKPGMEILPGHGETYLAKK